MTLTELRYIVTLAQERHFGRAAERCYVSQPTLSVAVKKLEEELGIALFERSKSTVQVTPLGEKIAVFTPITWPWVLKAGPPELPRLMGASICRKSS